jgi:hypothetical protein
MSPDRQELDGGAGATDNGAMAARSLAPPIALDPLIAEAKRRTRQRRLLVAVLAVLVFVAALATTLALRHSAVVQPTASGAVLGSTKFSPYPGSGWGSAAPTHIWNGGDCLGTVVNIRWEHWGSPTASGVGQTCSRPVGPYIRIELRATDLGRCSPSGPVAYLKLYVRERPSRRGPFSPWDLALCGVG